jgi:hypothetical protein
MKSANVSAQRDQQVADGAMDDSKGLLAKSAGAPDRVQRELEAFPSKICDSDTAEVRAQAAQPSRRGLSGTLPIEPEYHLENRNFANATIK